MAAMSFRKRLITLTAVIGALAVVYVLGLVFSPASVRKRELERPLVEGLETDAVASIQVSTADGNITLQKQGEEWQVPIDGEQYPASRSRIEGLLDFLQTTNRSRLVTANPESWEDFGVSASAAQKIELRDAAQKPLLSLLVGKVDEGRGGTYVRLEKGSEVVLVNRLFDFYLNTSGRYWSYLRMFPEELEGADINRISVKSVAGFLGEDRPPLSYTLLLGEGRERNWKLLDSDAVTELDNAKVDRLANALAGLEGANFAGRTAQAGLDSPRAEILASTADGQDFRLLVGNSSGEDRFYAALEAGRYVYEIARFRVEGLFKPLSELGKD